VPEFLLVGRKHEVARAKNSKRCWCQKTPCCQDEHRSVCPYVLHTTVDTSGKRQCQRTSARGRLERVQSHQLETTHVVNRCVVVVVLFSKHGAERAARQRSSPHEVRIKRVLGKQHARSESAWHNIYQVCGHSAYICSPRIVSPHQGTSCTGAQLDSPRTHKPPIFSPPGVLASKQTFNKGGVSLLTTCCSAQAPRTLRRLLLIFAASQYGQQVGSRARRFTLIFTFSFDCML
jgi:hypothetical protein